MELNNISARILKLFQQSEIKKMDRRHEDLVLEERRIKYEKEINEQKRIEMNRRMNRNGQNIDRMV